MARERCYGEYTARSKTKSWRQEDAERELVKIKEQLAREGKTFDSTVDQDLAVFKAYEKTINNTQKNSTQKMMKRLSTFDALTRIEDQIIDIKNKSPKTLMNRIVGMVFNTNDTKGLVPFEQLMKTNEKLTLGDFFQKVSKAIDGEDPAAYLTNKKNFGQVMSEYNEFFKNPNTSKSVTGNTQAFNVARELFDAQFKIAEMKKSNGFNSLLSDLRLRPKWSMRKIKKANKDQFVDRIANALDPEVHGDVLRRQELANDLYENMLKDNSDWRMQGDKSPQNIDVDNHIPMEDRKPTLAFKDGDAYVGLIDDFADGDSMVSLLMQFREMARETALVQFFGADYRQGFQQFKRLVDDNIQTKETKAALHYLENKVNPVHLEHNTSASIMTGLRGFQASSKLGSAVITALMDVPAMIFSGKHLFGLPTHKLIGSFFGYSFKGAPQDFRKYAEYMLEGVDTYLNNVGDRFGHIGQGTAGDFENIGAKTANAVFKLSGLNWWTEGRKAMALGIYGKELGNLIKGKTAWDTLKPQFKQQLEKFGIRKKDWINLQKTQPLDANGRLDIFAVVERDWEFSYGKSSLRQKLSAAFNDAVDTMIMTPGDYDIAVGALFNEPGSWGSEISKTLLQFKTHPIAYTRKIIARSYKGTDSKLEFAKNMTILGTEMMLMGIAVVQLKEIVKGKQPRRLDDANLYIRAAEQSGAYGLFSDVFMQFVGQGVISQFTDEPTSSFRSEQDKASQLLGPLVGDILSITTAPEVIFKDILNGKTEGLLNKTSDQLLSYVPFQNIWWLTMFKRMLIHDYWKERTNPRAYRKQQKRLQKIANDNRVGGKTNNIIYDTIRGN
tara:strand:- start:2161 stop:4671 length:2511 start_codon:yes stop_codon:yes gene_type:complete